MKNKGQNHSQIQERSGIYTCADCGKRTRDTGRGEAAAGLCANCFDAAETANLVNDGDLTAEEFTDYLRKIDYQGIEFA